MKYADTSRMLNLYSDVLAMQKKDLSVRLLSEKAFKLVIKVLDQVSMHEELLGVADAMRMLNYKFDDPQTLEVFLNAACHVDGKSAVMILKDVLNEGHEFDFESGLVPIVHRCLVQDERELALEALKLGNISMLTSPDFYDSLVYDVLACKDEEFCYEALEFLKHLTKVPNLSADCIHNGIFIAITAGDLHLAVEWVDHYLETYKVVDSEKHNLLFQHLFNCVRDMGRADFAEILIHQMIHFDINISHPAFRAGMITLGQTGNTKMCKKLYEYACEVKARKKDSSDLSFNEEIFAHMLECCQVAGEEVSFKDWMYAEMKKNWISEADVEDYYLGSEIDDALEQEDGEMSESETDEDESDVPDSDLDIEFEEDGEGDQTVEEESESHEELLDGEDEFPGHSPHEKPEVVLEALNSNPVTLKLMQKYEMTV
eukprot:TRINITY_DN18163_c0_g1_i1.p1 TRINITY_DN18163_c0_g1~~TRINITY_DN18163_c0_g1_i1.p1  ORF type:complete len:491 (-),score=151.62 TRINITY_DN18163_c0_g1_i1:12-1298(-)